MARNPHFNGEYDSILWFCGTTSLALVNLKDLSYVELKNFLPSHGKGQDGIAIRGVMKNAGKELLVFFIVDNQPCLAYFGPGLSEPDIHFVEDCLPTCKPSFTPVQNLADLELNLDKSVVFFSGNTAPAKGGDRSNAIVAACRFDKSLQIIDQIELTEQNSTVAFCIKQSTKENILFVGCMKSLYVLEWKNNKLLLIMIAINLHSSSRKLMQASFRTFASSERRSTPLVEKTSTSLY